MSNGWMGVDRGNPDPLKPGPRRVTTKGLADQFYADTFLDTVLGVGYGSNREQIRAPYRESVWVHAAVKIKGAAVRSVPLRFYETDPEQDPTAVPIGEDDPLVQLFKRPMKNMTASMFFEAGTHHRILSGEDFWVLHDERGGILRPDSAGFFDLPAQVQPIAGTNVEHREDDKGNVIQWRFRAKTANPVTLAADQIIQFRDYDMHNPNRGVGDVEVLMRALQQEFTAERYTEALLENSGDPGGFIKIKETLSPETQREVQAQAEEEFAVENRGRHKVISGDDVEYIPNKLGPRDMEFIMLFQKVRDQVASTLGVPLPVMGVLDRATWNNYAQAHFAFWTGGNGVIPYLRSVEDTIRSLFLARLKEPRYRNLFPQFDTSGITALQAHTVEKAESARDLVRDVPGMTWPRASTIVGLEVDAEEQDALDIALVGKDKIPFELAISRTELPDESQDADEDGDEEPVDSVPAAAAGMRRLLEDWRQLEDDVDEFDRKLKSKARAYLRKYELAQTRKITKFARDGKRTKATASKLTEKEIAFLLLLREEWDALFIADIGPFIEEVVASAGTALADELGVTFIGMTDPDVIEFLLTQEIKVAEGVNSTLAKLVKNKVLDALREADTIGTLQEIIAADLPEIQGNLRKAFSTRDQRASAIAPTEVAKARNGARFMQMRKTKAVKKHRWLTAGDAAVRHSHQELHGRVLKLGENFGKLLSSPVNGLLFPGAGGAPAKEVVNCRCSTQPVLEEDS